MKQIAADLLAEVGTDRVVRPDQCLCRREAAVDRDVLRQNRPRVAEGERADGEKDKRYFR